jgi:PAS domain S-box-containing protein
MNTILAGNSDESISIMTDALRRRQHSLTSGKPDDDLFKELLQGSYPLVILSDFSEEGLQFIRKIRALETGKRYTIIAVISKEQLDQIHRLLDADVDQYIVESLFDRDRLDVRLAFAEKMARNKEGQFLIEQKLKESEARSRSILRTTVDAIITIDNRGSIRTFNRAAENLFKYEASEVVGKNVKVLMPHPYKREHDDYMENYHKTGKRKIIGIGRDVTGRRKDGSTFPMYLAVSEVNVNGNRLYTGIIRDITEQRRLEQEILRISEHERRRIGQDLHDGLGQMLTGIRLINRNIAHSLHEENHPLAGELDDITRLLKEADEFARNLSRGLIPVELDGNGLNAALERLVHNAERLLNISCTLTLGSNIQFHDNTSLIHLYRIAQEATSNAVKHGNASEVHITLKADEEKLTLQIDDNGTGFAPDWDEKKGLGVRIMMFRARLIGANVDISDSNLGGASVIVTLLSVGSTYYIQDSKP